MKKEEFIRQLEYLLQDIQEDDKRDAIDYYSDYLEEAGPEREAEVLEGFGSPERIASMIRTELLGGMEGAGEFTDNGYDDHRFNTSSYPAVKGREQQEHSRSGESRSDGEYRRDREYRGNGYRGAERTGNSGSRGNYEKGNYADKSQGANPDDGKWWKYLLIALGILFAGPFVIAAVFGAFGTATGFVAVLAVCLLVLAVLTLAGILGGIAMVVTGLIQLFGSFWIGVMSIGLGLVFTGVGLLLLCCSWLFYGKFLPWAVMGIAGFVKKLFHKGGKNPGNQSGNCRKEDER